MKTRIYNLAIFVVAMAALQGCETMYGGSGITTNRRSSREQAAIKQEMERQQLRQDAQAARITAQSAESRLDQVENRIDRLENSQRSAVWATPGEVEALRRENQELRAELAEARAEHTRLRDDIITGVQGLLKEQQKKAPPPTTTRETTSSGYEHKVESGQTLSAIAQAYGVSVKKIKDANGLKDDVIRVGQTLFIPD